MRILLTGSSGWLGSALAPRLRALGHDVTGLDPVPSAETHIVGSIADCDLVMRTVRDNRIERPASFPKPTTWRMRSSSRMPTPRPMNCCFAG
ncbi:NAD-dependent epimerase/dehydratase family protein [Mesorhizobium sp. M0621]|uniref:NAD-dependent epimerase/dehydratase family protein n=1 Tax=Mesorhizobium sp. M0621 TaxID=2956974 RepID=UPI00333739DF